MRITHYSRMFDDRGQPIAVDPEHFGPDDVAGELPEGWDDTFWRWHPAGDLGGAWVPDVSGKREALWDDVKVRREAALAAGCTVLLGGESHRVQTDPVSRARLSLRLAAAMADPAAFSTMWTMADDTQVPLDAAGMVALAVAVDAFSDAIHQRSQELRAKIFDPARVTLPDLSAIELTFTAKD